MTTPPQPLPPALARLASALELSSGFLLYFITGPRDHADSVYLRLLALEQDFELVRHRIHHVADLEFFDVLTGGVNDRPRVVFLSGLEAMDTTTRREITERLNLLRDSWAPHPARIIFWLPSWGLAEFRRIAPDLFDWRSGLITLNDADLPIRSELEYLVWACERHGGPRRLLIDPGPWRAFRSLFDRLPHHVALVGLDPAERHTLLRDLALGFARDALNAAVPDPLRDDLDNTVGWTHTTGTGALLVRSQDAAGLLTDDASPWDGLARAAGVPGPESAAPILSGLAADGRLLVILDAFDRLDLAEEQAPRRWLDRLMSSSPRLKLFAASSGPSANYFATWAHASLESLAAVAIDDDLAPQFDQHLELIRLIQVLFSTSEDLSNFANYVLGPETDELRLEGPRELVATRLILACARRGLLDASFFAELARMRPAHAAEIETVARSLTAP